MKKAVSIILFLVGACLTYRLRQQNRYAVVPLPFGLRGCFLPPFGTLIDPAHDSPQVREHEECHRKQWLTLGTVPFYLAYLTEYLTYGYEKMPLEIECRANESPYCQQNYTDCYPKSF